MGSTRPRSVISPVMATSLRTGMPVSALTMAVAMVMPADGPSLGMAPGRHVDVERVLLERLARDAQRAGVGADPGQAGTGRLAHHLAQLAGEDEVLLALHAGDLDGDDVAADLGDDEPVAAPVWSSASSSPYSKRVGPEVLDQLLDVDDGLALAALRHACGRPCA